MIYMHFPIFQYFEFYEPQTSNDIFLKNIFGKAKFVGNYEANIISSTHWWIKLGLFIVRCMYFFSHSTQVYQTPGIRHSQTRIATYPYNHWCIFIKVATQSIYCMDIFRVAAIRRNTRYVNVVNYVSTSSNHLPLIMLSKAYICDNRLCLVFHRSNTIK